MQSEVFQAIPKLLLELDSKDQSMNNIAPSDAMTQQHDYSPSQEHDPRMAAFNQRFMRMPYRPRPPANFNFRPRLQTQRPFVPRFTTSAPYRPRQTGANYTAKFCSLCRDAGLPPRVYQTHNLSECGRLNRSTVGQLRSLVLDENIRPEDYPEQEMASFQYENEHVDYSNYGEEAAGYSNENNMLPVRPQ